MTHRESLVLNHVDVLRLDTELPLEGTYYPIGFRLHVATNSHDVLRAAEESWGGNQQEYECEAIEYRVQVAQEGEATGIPVHRAQEHLYSVVSDPHNFAQIDRERLFASFFVSQATAADHTGLQWHYLESLAYMLLAQRYVAPVHSACVARNGRGLMLTGASGAGKSTLSFACARAGWTFVSDDCVFLLVESGTRIAIGRPRHARFRIDAPGLFPELEGYAAHARPGGKISIEAAMTVFPEIRTAANAVVETVVLLDRQETAEPSLKIIDAEEALVVLSRGGPNYGPKVNGLHERTIRRLADVPAYRLQYSELKDALRLLDEIA